MKAKLYSTVHFFVLQVLSMPPVSRVKTLSRPGTYSALALVLALMAACATPPQRQTLTPVAPDSLASAQTLAGQTGAWPDQTWWQGFNDPQLNALMDEALANSPNLQAAQARLEKAQAVSDQVKAAMDPDLTLNASTSETKQSLNMGFPAAFQSFLPQGYWNETRITLDANYDIDLWGKSHDALKAAAGSEKAAALDTQVARTDITTALARAYVELARLYDERDSLAELKMGADIKVSLDQARFDHNVDPKDVLIAAQDEQQQVISRIATLDSLIKVQGDLIAALVGAGPDRALSLTRPKLAPTEIATLPADVRLNLLARRPDVQAAMLRVEAQDQGIRYARADYYPNLKLNAYFGIQALSKGGFNSLFDSGSDIGGIGPAISLPLFHQKRLDATYKGYEADYDSAVATYDQAIVSALQQVADAAGKAQATADQLQAAQSRVDLAQQAYDLSKARMASGLASKIEVLTAHSRLVTAQSALSDLQAQAYTDRIAFIAALGGGYSQ